MSIHSFKQNGGWWDVQFVLLFWMSWWTHDEKTNTREKTRERIKRREESGYFDKSMKELRIEDRQGFRELFRMDATYFEFILNEISHLIAPKLIK